MKTVLLAYLLLSVAFAIDFTKTPVHSDIIYEVNNADTTWKAGVNERFSGATLAHVKNLCGTILDEDKVIRLPRKEIEVADAIPSDFDARTGFPVCADRIGHIRDQADCGSCWAFGSTEAFNDRLCISTKGSFQAELSAQDTTSCCGPLKCMSFGCNGGQPSGAWHYFTKYGVVTGGDSTDKGKGDSCWPYQLDMCSHHVNDPKIKNCSSAEEKAPTCRTTCSETGYKTPFSQDKHFAKSSYSVSGVDQIQTEIMKNGPVTGAFTVYADFPTYKSGVYKHVSGDQLGGHAIRILGWGVENGEDYWLVANSWNADWGDKGYFKIARGNDECGIESNIHAGLV